METTLETKEIFLHADFDSDSHLPTEVLSASKKTLGSILQGQSPLSPLSDEEERKYLPRIIGVSPNDNEWREEVRNYWANLSISVGTDGIKLNITKDDSENPINVEDWIKFRFAKSHPLVADDKEGAQGNPNKQFYILDPDRALERENQQKKRKAEAWSLFIQNQDDESFLNTIIRIMDNRNPATIGKKKEKQNIVTDFVEERPNEFLEYASDDDLKVRAFVQAAINNEIIRRVGDDFYYNDRVIGESVGDVMTWITQDTNSMQFNEIKSKLENIEG